MWYISSVFTEKHSQFYLQLILIENGNKCDIFWAGLGVNLYRKLIFFFCVFVLSSNSNLYACEWRSTELPLRFQSLSRVLLRLTFTNGNAMSKRLNYAMVATRLKCNSHTDVIKNKNKRNNSDNKVGNQKPFCGNLNWAWNRNGWIFENKVSLLLENTDTDCTFTYSYWTAT